MKISYDYSDMIKELKDELTDGILSITDNIQVLRAEQVLENGYRPIIDWYYDDRKIEEDLKSDIFDDEQEIEEKRKIKEQYKKDKPSLSNILVGNCILEMEELNKII